MMIIIKTMLVMKIIIIMIKDSSCTPTFARTCAWEFTHSNFKDVMQA